MNRRSLLTLLILATGTLAGAVREFLFINLNYQIDHVGRGTAFSFAHSTFQGWVAHMDLAALVVLKWSLAVLTLALMWGLCHALLKLHGLPRTWLRLLGWTFLAGAAAALVAHGLARWYNGLEEASVNLLHALQYPFILFALWLLIVLRPAQALRPSQD